MNSNCPACNYKNIDEYIKIHELPFIIFPVKEELRKKIISDELILWKCSKCNHIFKRKNSIEQLRLIYEEYYFFYPFDDLESMNYAYRSSFENIFNSFCKSNNIIKGNLLEVGCSTGIQLDFFKNYNFNVFGIDPSIKVKNDEDWLICGYFENYVFNKKFDVIISRFNLEHLNNIELFFLKAFDCLNENGILILQVPNIETYIKNTIPFFAAHEHIHYFNSYSIKIVASRNGFETIKSFYKDTQSLIYIFSKSNSFKKPVIIEKNNNKIYNDFLKIKIIVSKKIEKIIKDSDKILCYGAGLTLCWILYELDFKHESNKFVVVDDNPVIFSKYMPQTDIMINEYKEININDFKKIILTLNPSYHKKIISRLKQDQYRGEIVLINNEGVITI